MKNGEVLLGYDDMKGFHLDLYDIKRGTSINLKDHANQISYSATTFVYVESLVPLNSGTDVGIPEIEDSRDGARSARTIARDRLTSGTHVRKVDREDSEDDDDDSEEEEEEEEGEEEKIVKRISR